MKKNLLRYVLTGAVVLIAVVAVFVKYRAYVTNPWTRDGQVRAQVIQITPRVYAPIINLPIRDNQFVKTGEVLFELDPRTFEAELAQSRANLELTRYEFDAMTPQVAAAEAGVLSAQAAVVQAGASIAEADVVRSEPTSPNAEPRNRKAPPSSASEASSPLL